MPEAAIAVGILIVLALSALTVAVFKARKEASSLATKISALIASTQSAAPVSGGAPLNAVAVPVESTVSTSKVRTPTSTRNTTTKRRTATTTAKTATNGKKLSRAQKAKLQRQEAIGGMPQHLQRIYNDYPESVKSTISTVMLQNATGVTDLVTTPEREAVTGHMITKGNVKATAELLNVREGTVYTYWSTARRKLGVKTIEEAAALLK